MAQLDKHAVRTLAMTLTRSLILTLTPSLALTLTVTLSLALTLALTQSATRHAPGAQPGVWAACRTLTLPGPSPSPGPEQVAILEGDKGSWGVEWGATQPPRYVSLKQGKASRLRQSGLTRS